MVREGRVITSTAGRPTFGGASYFVTAYEVGAQVAAASSGDTVTVRAGHGFEANDKGIVFQEDDASRYFQVGSVTSTTLVLAGGGTLSVAAGEYLVNLGTDTGFSAPNYDGSGATVYTDMDYTTEAASSTVLTTDDARYRYFHQGIARWELVRSDASTPFALYIDTTDPADEDRVSYQTWYPHLYATSGTGTEDDPWPGSAIQDAYTDWVAAGKLGKIKMVGGVFDLGSTGLDFDINGDYTTGFVLEGSGGGNEETGTVGPTYANDGGTMLLYSGSGEAIRVGDFATSGSMWMENSVLKGFKVRQTGTAGTGIGILMRLFRWGLIEDVTTTDFAVGKAFASVSDFNRIERCRVRDCTTYGYDVGRTTDAAGTDLAGTAGQCNANRFIGCDIMNSARSSSHTNWGIFVHLNSVGTIVKDGEFHNFNGTAYGAIRIDDATTDSNSVTVKDNYFEGCYYSVYHNNPFGAGVQTHMNVSVQDNYITQIEGIGIYINSGGAGGETRGANITGNFLRVPTAVAPYDTAVGIRLGTYCVKAVLMGNTYQVQSPAGFTLPGGNVVHAALGTLSGDNIILGSVNITSTDTSGTLDVKGASTLTGAVGCGAVTSTSNVTSGGHLRGLKSTSALTGSTEIATVNTFLIDITNTSGTNTPTLAAPSSVDGKILVLRCAALTAGTITLADSGNVALSAAWVPDAGDTLTLIASGVVWYEIARSAN